HDAALEQKGKGGKADVRMGHYIEILSFVQLDRAHMVYKYKGAHHPFLTEGQQSAHQELSQVGGPFFYDKFNIGHDVLRSCCLRCLKSIQKESTKLWCHNGPKSKYPQFDWGYFARPKGLSPEWALAPTCRRALNQRR